MELLVKKRTIIMFEHFLRLLSRCRYHRQNQSKNT